MDEVRSELTLQALPTQVLRALHAIHPGQPDAPSALAFAQRVFDKYRADQRTYSESVDETLAAKGMEQVDMDDPAARDAFHERIKYDIPAIEKCKKRDAAIEVYKEQLKAKAAAIEEHNRAQRQ